jgi:hypothetical protein
MEEEVYRVKPAFRRQQNKVIKTKSSKDTVTPDPNGPGIKGITSLPNHVWEFPCCLS